MEFLVVIGLIIFSIVVGYLLYKAFSLEEVKPEIITFEPKLITTNPPAREIALKNRKENDKKNVEYRYNSLIEKINYAIKYGELELLTGYHSNDHTLIKAARKIKADGFTVKIKTTKTRPHYKYDSHSNAGQNHFGPAKSLYISWK